MANAQMDDTPEPNAFEKRLRFGCGFIFGILVTIFIVGQMIAAFTTPAWAGVFLAGVIAGFLAMRYGDEFWKFVLGFF